MEYRIHYLERNVRKIMEHLHLDYEEPCKVCGKRATNTCTLCADKICAKCYIMYNGTYTTCSQQCITRIQEYEKTNNVYNSFERTDKRREWLTTTNAGSVKFFSPHEAVALAEQARIRATSISAASSRFVPVEDGFISTAGNKELGAMYGNTTGSNRINYMLQGTPNN